MMSRKDGKNEGFTLIEILVVMVIIGILSTIGLRSFASSQSKSRDSRRKSDLRQIGVALEAYYNDRGEYPEGSGGDIIGCDGIPAEDVDPTACSWGGDFADGSGTTYMVKLPADPSSNEYYYVSDGSSYQMYARLENTLDIDVPKNAENEGQVYDGTSCGTYVCNYGVASTNSVLTTTVDE